MGQTETKEELLRHATRLLLSRGYSGFSFQDLADHLGVRKASIHYYFASKAALLEDVITSFDEAFDRFAAENAALPPDQRLRRYFGLFRRMTDEGYLVCLAGALTVESEGLSETALKKLTAYQRKHRRWVRDLLQEGQGGAFHRKIDPKEDSLLLCASLQAGVQIARLHRSPAVLEQIIDSLEKKLLGGKP